MAMLMQNINGHIQNQLTRSLEKILDDANQSGELKLSSRKLKDFPKISEKYNLSDTVIADLSKNRFSELPEEVTSYQFLERLHCYHNAIRYIPDTICNLQSLIYLDLSRNHLTSLPRELCHLPIKILLVSNNALTHLPDELHRMSHLTELDASSNHLTHLPPRLADLKSLQSLVLRHNQLLAIPLDLTTLPLARLDVRANRIALLPLEIRAMVHLVDLHVEDNPLTSPPAALCRRGRVHIFKHLESEALRLERKTGGTLGRRPRACDSPGLLADRLRGRRANVDSGYSTGSDCFEKRWSQEVEGEKSWTSTPVLGRNEASVGSTPSTVSPTPNDDELGEERNGGKAALNQIQTYKEYKEALKQQRAQEVPSIYRTKDCDDGSYKTEPNTPTHYAHASLATSKSDPTPLNTLLTSRLYEEAGKKSPDYIKPKSPSINNGEYVSICVKNGSPIKPTTNGVKSNRSISWNKDLPAEKMTFTMRREIDKAKEETDLINQLRNIIENRLKMALPQDLSSALTDGVVLCHLANHIKPRSVASIHVPSPAVPKLTMARCRRNVENFIEACRKIGVDQGRLCSTLDVNEALASGRGLPRLLDTIEALCELRHDSNVDKSELHTNGATEQDTTVSLLLLTLFFASVAFFFYFPPPN